MGCYQPFFMTVTWKLALSIRVGFGYVLVTRTKMRQKNKAAYEKLPLTHRTYKVLVRESDILECWYT